MRILVAAALLVVASGCSDAEAQRAAKAAAVEAERRAQAEITRLAQQRLDAEREVARLQKEADDREARAQAAAAAVAFCAPLDQQQESINNMWRTIEADYPHSTQMLRRCDKSTQEATQNCLANVCLAATIGGMAGGQGGCIDLGSRIAGVGERQQELNARRASPDYANCPVGVFSELP